jgi:hypothetical protein
MKKITLRKCCTGMTLQEFKREMKAIDKGRKHSSKKCYLCKRPGDSTSVLLGATENDAFTFPKLTLWQVNRPVTKDWILDYYLCFECAILIGIEPPHSGRPSEMKEKGEGHKDIRLGYFGGRGSRIPW